MLRKACQPSRAAERSCPLLIIISFYYLLVNAADLTSSEQREFHKPPSPCLTGASCKNCANTVEFHRHQVCCYHCRLDNIVIHGHVCHCLDTRLPHSALDAGGNCSSGQICDNCAVKISADPSNGAEATPGIPSFCCQDCGLVTPYLYRDEKGCHCDGNSQGRQHQTAPKYDPLQDSTTTQQPDSNAATPSLSVTSMATFLWLMLLVLCS